MKKFFAFVLTAAMAVSALNVVAFADDAEAPAETPVAAAPAEDAEAPAETPEEAPAEDAEAPAETPEEAPAEDAEAPAETPAEDAETPEEAPAETPEEAPAEAPEEVPAAEATPVAPAEAKAVVSNAKVTVNGEAVELPAYNIDGNNYFKLRDVAVAVAGTVANFEVGYDKEAKAVTVTTGAAYTGSTEVAAVAGDATAKASVQKVVLDGEDADLVAYNIGGYNYFKLRDLGEVLGFTVAWDKEARVIDIVAEVLPPVEDDKVETPADDATAPADDTTAPADDATAPADDTTAPADDATAPADDAAAPADDTTAPADAEVQPAETEAPEATAPAEA